MRHVYIAELDKPHERGAVVATSVIPFSSKWRAIAYFNGALNKPKFEWLGDIADVTVKGKHAGWLTKAFIR